MCLILSAIFLCSCIDETFGNAPADGYISISGIASRNGVPVGGDAADDLVKRLRVLAFDKSSGECKVNRSYFGTALTATIQLPIAQGTYSFVFLANEATAATAALESVNWYNDLGHIAYPAAAFDSNLPVPMIRIYEPVQILSGGFTQVGDNPSTTDVLIVKLERMGVRVDVLLKAEEDLSAVFTGVTFSNIPNEVPLMPVNYEGGRDESRTFTLVEDAGYFDPFYVTDAAWGMQINRIVLPANDFNDATDDGKAFLFTVNLDKKFSPSCKLRISDSNYTLPKNTRLDLNATVKIPLDVSMLPSDWETDAMEWGTAEIRALNVSQLTATITDFNGARISFSSNLPVVRVADVVTLVSSGGATLGTPTERSTNDIFNDLVATGALTPTRFYYDKATGSGYMDILADANAGSNSENTYKLFLIAEHEDGSNQLRREITITVKQYGKRFDFSAWGDFTGYVGAFFKNSETGERIITGQHAVGAAWSAEVIEGSDWISISSAPSFDPNVGTDTPGKAENYEVRPNAVKYDPDGWNKISGKGRIYFRLGTRGTNATGKNRYGVVQLTFYYESTKVTQRLYVRQGEDPDYVFGPDDEIPSGILIGKSRTAARKFSPYNLTASVLKDGTNTGDYADVNPYGGVFVDYPTQAGAFFQWGTDKAELPRRRAYHPTRNAAWNYADSDDSYAGNGFWDAREADNETCPSNYNGYKYVRPNDGDENRKIYNGPYRLTPNAGILSASPDDAADWSAEIEWSTFRTSLFKVPKAGNSYGEGVIRTTAGGVVTAISADVYPTYPYSSSTPITGYDEKLDETNEGFYADGFFDRRPVQVRTHTDGTIYKAVSIDNADIAYSGLLFFNTVTKASLFFPSAGRLNDNTGTLECRSAGYYWSSSAGPWYPNAYYPAWWISLGYYHIEMATNIKSFGCSVRCVKSEVIK